MRPCGPTAHPSPPATKLMAWYAPLSNSFQVLPPSTEESDPEVPVTTHSLRPDSQATAERKPLGPGLAGADQVRPPSEGRATFWRSSRSEEHTSELQSPMDLV